MLLAKLPSGVLVRAEPGLVAVCPGCEEPVVPKCGTFVVWHFAHAPGTLSACDTWTEPETEWHLGWKSLALEHGCRVEVTMRDGDEWHRADVVRADGKVVEIQHSQLGYGQAQEREQFYRRHGGLIWLWDAKARGYWDALEPRRDGRYHWERPSTTLLDLRAPVFWDVAGDLYSVRINQSVYGADVSISGAETVDIFGRIELAERCEAPEHRPLWFRLHPFLGGEVRCRICSPFERPAEPELPALSLGVGT